MVKLEFINAMSLGYMNISRLMTHAQKVDGDKLMEHAKQNRKPRTEKNEYSQQNSGGGNRSQGQQKFSAPSPSSTSVPFSKNRYDQKG